MKVKLKVEKGQCEYEFEGSTKEFKVFISTVKWEASQR